MIKKYVNYNTYNDENISKYFKDLKKTNILSPKEELRLAKRIRKGDTAAIDKLVSSNLRFVISIAKEYQNQGLSFNDLISEGNYGLVKAAQRFDHSRGFRFISYAVWWIKQSIIQGLNDNARTVRLPTNVINKITSLKKEIERFELVNETKPVYADSYEVMNLFESTKCISLNDVINEDGDELIELMKDESIDENRLVIDDRIRKELNDVLSILDDRERDIIECYFGINTNCESMTLEGIGDKYSLSKERIRQIKDKALRKIRHSSSGLLEAMNE